MKKIFEIEWRLDDINQHDILLALKRHNPIWQVLDVTELKPEPKEEQYPCADCGKLRTKAEGGTTFTVCDECWDKSHKPKEEYCSCKFPKECCEGHCIYCHKLIDTLPTPQQEPLEEIDVGRLENCSDNEIIIASVCNEIIRRLNK